jgi:hypothetical protein
VITYSPPPLYVTFKLASGHQPIGAVGRFINNIATDILDPCLQRTPTVEWALEMLSELAFQCMGLVKQDMAAMSDVQGGHARRQPTLGHRHHQP